MSNCVEINLPAFARNLDRTKKIIGEKTRIAAILKADAYGHGFLKLAEVACKKGVSCIALGAPDEALEFKSSKNDCCCASEPQILILDGATFGYEKDLIRNNISSVISNMQQLESFESAAKNLDMQVKIHIKVDTGMGRLGVNPDLFFEIFEYSIKKKCFSVDGIMTHFALSYDKNDEYTNFQNRVFKKALEKVTAKGYSVPVVHAANSGAILNFPDSYFDMVRPGIILYGSMPSYDIVDENDFEPVMQVKSKIVHISDIKKGEGVGYGKEYIAIQDSKVAVLPIGYSHGYSRLLSNKAEVLVRGQKAPQIGIISMDLTVIDITKIGGASIGDEVVLIGKQGNSQITVEEVAKKIETIPYEILCMIGNNNKKSYVDVE